MNAFRLIQSDYTKYKKYGGSFMTIVFFTQGFWASLQYRVAHGVYRLKIPVLKQILHLICMIWHKVIEITTSISIPASANSGSSFYIGHFGGIIINSNTVMGSNCNISQNYQNWPPKVKLIIIDLHDGFERGCSKTFFEAINKIFTDYSLFRGGENIVIKKNGLE